MKVGIFTGTFDPIHEGHIALVHAAIKQCNLDKVFVIPEREPRGKVGVSPLQHRLAMASLAFPSANVTVTDVDAANVRLRDVRQLVVETDELYLLLGTDVAFTLKTWPEFIVLKHSVHFAVGIRSDDDVRRIHTLMAHLEVPENRYTCIKTDSWSSTSSHVRESQRYSVADIQKYIQSHSLYGV